MWHFSACAVFNLFFLILYSCHFYIRLRILSHFFIFFPFLPFILIISFLLKYLTQFSIIVFHILFHTGVFFLYVCVKYFLVLCRIIICNLWWKFYLLKFILRNIIYFLLFHFQVQMENKLKAVIYCDIKVSWWFIGACFSFGIMIIPII